MTIIGTLITALLLGGEGAGPVQPSQVEIPARCTFLPIIETLRWANEVCLHAYLIDRTPVTVAAYQQCVDAGVCRPAWG